MSIIHHGDCLEIMAVMEPDSIDAIVTDPPYGLGFMGKAWDDLPPGEDWARECLRVLKPGGHLLAFGGTRTWHRLAVAVEDAGFEIRDSIAWMYGSGFPKSKATLKPAFEPVVMARKKPRPREGLLNIDACRIATDEDTGRPPGRPKAEGWGLHQRTEPSKSHASGRWPANVVLDESQAAALDEQSGVLRGGARPGSTATTPKFNGDTYGSGKVYDGKIEGPREQLNGGGASRFFYVAKAPKKERPVIDGVAHPTVKPLALMRWLCRLVAPEGGTILDPFAGSGTTLEAARLEGFHAIGIEREAEYLPLIHARLNRNNDTLDLGALA